MSRAKRPLGPRPSRRVVRLVRGVLQVVARKFRWYLFDYSQIEARLFADEAQEPTMLAAFAAGRDVYEELASKINKQVGTKLLGRQEAKQIFLAKIYGLGKKKLARQLGISRKAAMRIIAAFNKTFPLVTAFFDKVKAEVEVSRNVTDRYGRVIPVDGDFSYKGVNYKIQGAAGFFIKRAMRKIHEYLEGPVRAMGYTAYLVLQVHDELIVEAQHDLPMSVVREIGRLMSDSDGVWKVATPVETSTVDPGKSWLDKRPLRRVIPRKAA
jgi:DNA polymerase-1